MKTIQKYLGFTNTNMDIDLETTQAISEKLQTLEDNNIILNNEDILVVGFIRKKECTSINHPPYKIGEITMEEVTLHLKVVKKYITPIGEYIVIEYLFKIR